ncbi:DNA-binding response regulator [candidate division GN15 bacterium]|uniref:DNA-binding response regulator n=1 Tax=candidate division GN15 bacterium TaxID=2072418 RepID=A0A855X3D7_9BACT|nr:MAG: DNA-binding response regulator [candidate division GN15 bacterium]
MSKGKVLIVDDEQAIRRFLRISLEAEGYDIVDASSGKEAITLAASHVPDLVILDLGLPDIDGSEVLDQIRQWSKLPVIILTVRDAEREKVKLLDAGADDYLTKPFGVPELLARVRVALRRNVPDDSTPAFKNGFLEIDFAERKVTANGKPVKLTVLEFNLLALLARHAGKLLTQHQLLKEVWGPGSVEHSQYLRVYIGQLRRKLEPHPERPILLLTEPGIGYRMTLLE